MASNAPAELVWEQPASDLIDELVDSDARYIDLQPALEDVLIRAVADPTELARLFSAVEFEGTAVYLHRCPPFFHAMPGIWIAFIGTWLLRSRGPSQEAISPNSSP